LVFTPFLDNNLSKIIGTDNDSTISGIWIWPGQQLAFELCPDWQVDYESYEWKKLDPKDESTKKMVNEYLLWEVVIIFFCIFNVIHFRATLAVRSLTKGRFSNEHGEVR